MHEQVFRAIEAGGTVITAGTRLARVLSRAFHTSQQASGRRVWKTPDILPIGAFLERAWREWILRSDRKNSGVLLDSRQEQLIWEQVITESAGDSLLRIPETARHAMEAWELVQAYRLPMDGRFEASEDWSAFAAWSRAFRKRCDRSGWLERARLMDAVAALGEKPAVMFVAGFDELTPQQADLFQALENPSALEPVSFKPEPHRYSLGSSIEEIRASAVWAREKLSANPHGQIGVVIPDLKKLRGNVERIFRETLDPGGIFDDRERSYHLSLGPALDQYPIIRAALLILEFGLEKLELPQAGMMLRSPFLAGGASEWTRRAALDVKLRKKGVWDVTVRRLQQAADHCPVLQSALRRFGRELEGLPQTAHASEWSRYFSRILEAIGWPGERALSSRENQAAEAWITLLSNFSALDVTSPQMSYHQAFGRVREFAIQTPFQVENEGAPVQIMGLLETPGLNFDHLWITGLHDEALPASANLHPFLPTSLQQEYGLPHSSAERELNFATNLMDRLRRSAPDVVLSYPQAEGDRALAPSPVVAGGWQSGNPTIMSRSPQARPEMEVFLDSVAPPVVVDSRELGGSSLFKDMAECPFRAFGKHRLGARPLEAAALGPSYQERGIDVHKAMEAFWVELGSQQGLLRMPAEELAALIRKSVDVAIVQLGPKIGAELERKRLEKVIGQWVEIEKARAPFEVLKPEEEKIVSLGGLQIKIRADRIDEISDGRQIILDYKTGQVKTAGWNGERPSEPQLPLYCATSDRPIAGAAFVLIRVGELTFRGATEAGVTLQPMKKMNIDPPAPLGVQILEWRRVLERLAEKYREGHAEVDPKPDACDYCGLRAMCRIRESVNDRG